MTKAPEIVFENRKILLKDIVDTADLKCVMDEVTALMKETYPHMEFARVRETFNDIVSLYAGEYPGYRECTTAYHDLRHTMDVFLAMARLIHGAHTEGVRFEDRDVLLGLVSALLHDTGYILEEDDRSRTGGRYTNTHVERSVSFMIRYFVRRNYTSKDAVYSACLIESTSLAVNFGMIPYATPQMEELGRMIFAADLFGQMADRTYLEKLHLLYHEFVEGDVREFKGEEDLLRKTVDFVEEIRKRVSRELEGFTRYMKGHFRHRCNIGRDFYSEAVQSNLGYLRKILAEDESDYRRRLQRMGILERIGNLSN